MQISSEMRELGRRAARELAPVFEKIDEVALENTERVLDAFRKERISEAMLSDSTGYGYGDVGRDATDLIAAKVFGGEAGFMRPAIICGTHALTIGLFGLLRPGDTLLSVTGAPYDTLGEVIGTAGTPGNGSLADFGVKYREVPLRDGTVDMAAVKDAVAGCGATLKVVFIQRSKGYLNRKTLTVDEILSMKKQVEQVYMHDLVYQYLVSLVNATRHHQLLALGVSPRGTIALSRMASAYAYMHGRDYVVPDDIAAVFLDVCQHRVILNTKARVGNVTAEQILNQILSVIEKPKAKKG